jgi:hypothetical protein
MTTRKIILYVALLAIILGTAPFVTGYLVEAKFNDVVKVLSDIQSMPVSIKVTEYKRGWR